MIPAQHPAWPHRGILGRRPFFARFDWSQLSPTHATLDPSPRVKSSFQPLNVAGLNGHHVKTAGRHSGQARQKKARRKHNAPLLHAAHTGRRAAMAAAGPLAHLDKHQSAIGCAHDEVYFTAATPWRSIIALNQPQLVALQMRQCQRLGCVTRRFGGGFSGRCGRCHSGGWHGVGYDEGGGVGLILGIERETTVMQDDQAAVATGADLDLTGSASYGQALMAARQAAASQHYPQGALYVVATPIGNLADVSLRALHVLQLADTIACEDTRHTQALLRAYGIDKNTAQLLALHQHNESEAAGAVVLRLRQGQRVAYVSDAGTPGVSDPGARLTAAVQQAGLRCVPLPGASSVTTLISVAGLAPVAGLGASDEAGNDGASGIAGGGVAGNGFSGSSSVGFVFAGFLPTRASERAVAVQALAAETRAVVLLEAPHRIEAAALALAALGGRQLTVGRELTKQFEEIATMAAREVPAWLAAGAHRTRGEFAVVLHPVAALKSTERDLRVLKLLLAELPLKTAVKLAADITGEPKNALYDAALGLKAAS